MIGLLEVSFVAVVFACLAGSDMLYPFMPSTFRKRLDLLLARLCVPATLAFTPASLEARCMRTTVELRWQICCGA